MKDLTERISKLSAEKRKKLELKLEQQGIDISTLPIPPVERNNRKHFPLSFTQERLWFIHQLGNTAYNIVRITKLQGHPDKNILEKSINEIIRRHEILRTIFITENEKPVQVILPGLALSLEIIDLKGLPREIQEQKVQQVIRQESLHSFDLATAPLLRALLLEYRADEYLFLITIHHIVTDGFSLQIFEKELVRLYDGFSRGKDPVSLLPGLPLQYVDYTCWERQWFSSGSTFQKKQEKFWLQEFNGEIPVLTLPTDYPRPKMLEFKGSSITFNLDKEEKKALNEMAGKEKVSLYILLLAILNVFLSKLSRMEDIVIGTAVAGRKQPELQNIMGVFIKTIPLRNYPYHDKTFKDFLADVKKRTLTAFENQEYQYEELVKKILVHRDTSRNPLFDVMFNHENMDINETATGLTFKNYSYQKVTSIFDMTLIAAESGNQLSFTWEYRTNLFKEKTIRRFIHYFKKLVSEVSKGPGKTVSQLEILPEKMKQQVLVEFNRTSADYPADKNIHRLFREQVQRTPGKIALVGNDEEMKGRRIAEKKVIHLSYHELNERSNQWAFFLKNRGIQPETIVGIMVEPTPQMIVGILAILKVGGAYMPIDPDYPEERIQYILTDSRARFLVTTGSLSEKLSIVNCQLLMVNEELAGSRRLNTPNSVNNYQLTINNLQLKGTNLAYIIYTSGSTGRPKGVMVQHKNVVRLVINSNFIDFERSDRLLLTGAAVFDITTFEIWGPLLNGLSLFLVNQNTILEVEKLANCMTKNKISILHLVPQLFKHLADQGIEIFERLKYFLVGGDLVPPQYVSLLKNTYKNIKILHMYGPTENTTFSTFHLVNQNYHQRIPIGKPISNTFVLILDESGHPVPIGIPGELVLGGDGVARGYLNNPELTAEKFCHVLKDYQHYHDGYHRSYKSYKSYIIYKTGDLGRWLPEGLIEFIGRLDNQVKIRGIRVELGEIETQLLKHKEIKEAVVIPGKSPDDTLCAYFTVKEAVPGGTPGTMELIEYLSERVPDYMVPSYFVRMEKLPLTPNGKIDIRALPEPETAPGKGYTAPVTPLEKKLAAVWAEVLGNTRLIGIHDNFFHIGGHSLKAAILAAKIHKETRVKIPLEQLFNTPTIKGISSYIIKAGKQKYTSIDSTEKKKYYPLSPAQKRLYVLQGFQEENTAYNTPMVFASSIELDRTKLQQAFAKLIRRHEILRTSFLMLAEGPVQQVHEPHEVIFDIEYYNLGAGNSYKWDFIRPFDLSRAPLIRTGLIQTSAENHLLFVDIHHIISDGMSMEIISGEFIALYEGESLPPLAIQYKDYSQWMNHRLQAGGFNRPEAFWLKEFQGEIPVLNLPYDYSRPSLQSFNGASHCFEIAEKETAGLEQLASNLEATLYMVLLALVNVWLSRLSGQEDIVIGSPIASRTHASLEPVIGMLVNTLALRSFPHPLKSFNEFLKEIKERCLAAYENQEYPFEELVEQADIHRDVSRNPLFDVMLVLQNTGQPTIKSQTNPGRLLLEPCLYETRTSKFDLTFIAVPAAKRIPITLEYCTDLFKKASIVRFTSYFHRLVKAILANPDSKLGEAQIISKEEKQIILEMCTGPDQPMNPQETLDNLFESQVFRIPHHTAVVENHCIRPGIIRHITYDNLNRQANQLAQRLLSLGLTRESVVPLILHRSLDMVTGILAIIKAGGAYLPIDALYPAERKQYMLKDSAASLVITDTTGIKGIRPHRENNLHIIDVTETRGPSGNTTNPGHNLTGQDPVYVIYTSGSTGKPKGVLIQHGAVVNVLSYLFKEYPFSKKDTYLFKTPYIFDVSVSELFGWFQGGGQLAILENGAEKDPQNISATVERLLVTHINFVPSMFAVLVDWLNPHTVKQLSSLKYIFLAGETLAPAMIKKFRQFDNKIKLENIYGPTEGTVYVSKYSLSGWNHSGNIPIGKPLQNIELYIIDGCGNLTPVGITGELCTAGAGLARGYLNNPELTAERFDHDFWDYQNYHDGYNRSYRSYQSHILYRTGDLARWLPDGNIEFLGRIDQQVKIRGFRVEPGEIESLLLKKEEIKEAAVVVKEKQKGDKYLCAYIVLNMAPYNEEQGDFGIPGLKEYLSTELPDYMIPAYFIIINTIPRTGTGKIDRKALPEPQIKKIDSYIAPRNIIEKKIVEIWAQVLAIEKDMISADANFFRLGGHSLKAAVMAARIHKELKIKIPINEILKRSTLSALALYLKESAVENYIPIPPVEKRKYYDTSDAQKRVWVLSQSRESSLSFNIPGTYPFKEDVDRDALNQAFQTLIQRHESLRTVFLVRGTQLKQKVFTTGEMKFNIEYIDLRGLNDKEKKENELSAAEANTLFDLATGPLLRVTLVQIQEKDYLLLFTLHHIISDFISLEVLRKEVLKLYASFRQGATNHLKPLRIQYKDYTYWHNKQLQEANLEHLGQYWQNRFKNKPPLLELPYDKERPRVQTYNGEDVSFNISYPLTTKLRNMASQHQATLFMVLLASINALLFHYTGQTDITIGTPAAGRDHIDIENQIGLYLNTLALRTIFAEKNSFTQLLHLVKNVTLEAYAHQLLPFDRLVDQLKIKREASRHPLFDVMVDMLNLLHLNESLNHPPDQGEPGETRENETPAQLHKSRTKTDLIIYFHESAASILVTFEYNTDLFERQTIIRMISRYKKLLAAVFENPAQPMADLQVQEEVKIPAFAPFGLQESK